MQQIVDRTMRGSGSIFLSAAARFLAAGVRFCPMIGALIIIPAAFFPGGAASQTPQTKDVGEVGGQTIEVLGELRGFSLELASVSQEKGIEILTVKLARAYPATPPAFSLKWSTPSHDAVGHWRPGAGFSKIVQPDWSDLRFEPSMFARGAPVSTLFGSADNNVITVAVSDALNALKTGAGVREEDGVIYHEIHFFTETHAPVTEYTARVRIDRRPVPYWTALRGVSDWWAVQPGYGPAEVPASARLPIYSTWYNYHQSLDPAVLLEELKIAKKLGFESIIIDDGWQTLDSSRGYAFTGDWRPERIPDMRGFVDAAHALGVKVLLWYSVPYMGKNAKAATRFRDKTLRFYEEHAASVLDPRFPEVRQYLIDIYTKALREWNLDGFKLDFIDSFAADEDTVFDATGGRDYASVNEATDRLMTDILAELKKIKPDVLIEFRQSYIGPLMRKYGNMFRAGDCPNSFVSNRVQTTDLRLLSGDTAVHADMIMWHPGEPVELAAMQITNILFSVPQVSVRLQEIPREHFEMVRFYTRYWNENRSVLLDGTFEARSPLANYPILVATDPHKTIVGLYGENLVRLEKDIARPAIDVVNGKNSKQVVLSPATAFGTYRYVVRNVLGRVVDQGEVALNPGAVEFSVPVSGILSLQRSGK
jgi:alpha-galactosidase